MAELKPSDINLIKTCDACPEQYDAYNSKTNEKIGYLRLREGFFTVHNLKEEIVYTAYPKGYGEFLPEERDCCLSMAKICLALDYAKE